MGESRAETIYERKSIVKMREIYIKSVIFIGLFINWENLIRSSKECPMLLHLRLAFMYVKRYEWNFFTL